MNNKDWQIIELESTVKCTIKPSPIHGIGVFAIKDIKKGDRLYCFPQQTERKFYNVPYGSFNQFSPEVRELIAEVYRCWQDITERQRKES